ncbi:MAG: hypothetical protein WBX18_04605 [Terracidiphilus sp.]
MDVVAHLPGPEPPVNNLNPAQTKSERKECRAMQPNLGKMSAYKILNWQDRAASSIEQTVAAFLEIGEAIATRWIQTAKGVLLLQLVPGDDASGAIYVFDRRCDQWYMLSFEECEDRFTSEKFDHAFSEYDLFRLVEQPGLLLSEFQPATA